MKYSIIFDRRMRTGTPGSRSSPKGVAENENGFTPNSDL
jgi:hypothetical protein